jgi:hypothetical protein
MAALRQSIAAEKKPAAALVRKGAPARERV